MKKILALLTIASAITIMPAKAATWNDAFGMGNASDDWLITGSAQRHNMIASVRTNYLYWVGSAVGSGVPRITGVNYFTDDNIGTLDVWVATNVATVTNIQSSPGTNNVFFVDSTNYPASTVVVYRHVATDTYQFALVTNNAGAMASAPLVTYSSLTNTQVIGDKVYTMARVQQLRPQRADTGFTNQQNALLLSSNHLHYVLPPGVTIAGKIGLPLMVGTFITNHLTGYLNVSGEYYVRPRR